MHGMSYNSIHLAKYSDANSQCRSLNQLNTESSRTTQNDDRMRRAHIYLLTHVFIDTLATAIKSNIFSIGIKRRNIPNNNFLFSDNISKSIWICIVHMPVSNDDDNDAKIFSLSFAFSFYSSRCFGVDSILFKSLCEYITTYGKAVWKNTANRKYMARLYVYHCIEHLWCMFLMR